MATSRDLQELSEIKQILSHIAGSLASIAQSLKKENE